MAESETRVSRETRLLILVIGVAVVVLFVLAQFRFPEAEVRLSTVTPAGLDRLAAPSNYDDLASAVQTTMQGAEPSVIVFDVDGAIEGSKQQERRRIQAIRLRDGLAIAAMPTGFKSANSVGSDAPVIRGIDAAHGLLIAAQMTDGGPVRPASLVSDFGGYAYVAVVEPAIGGPSASPVFIGRIDPQSDPRWPGGDLLVPGGSVTLPTGSFIFMLDGRFVGLVVKMPTGSPAIVPAALLTAVLEAFERSATEARR